MSRWQIIGESIGCAIAALIGAGLLGIVLTIMYLISIAIGTIVAALI